MEFKTLKDLNSVELEYLLDYIKEKKERNYMILNGPKYYDNNRNKYLTYDRLRFEEKDKNNVKMFYNINNYKIYNLEKSHELECNIEINKIFDLSLNNIIDSIKYYIYLIRVYIRI